MESFYRWSLGLCLLLVLIRPCGSLAHADAAYDEAVRQGLAEFEDAHYPEALEEFRRAHALSPNARTLRGLGMVEFELRNYGECARLLEQALSSSVRPLDAGQRAASETLLGRARRYLGELHLETEPSSARVIVDGSSVELGSHGVLLLQVGEHSLEVQAPGRAPHKRTLQVRGGERTALHISLDSVGPSAAAHAETRQVDTAAPTPLYQKWWLWTAVAVVVVAGATTAAVVLSGDDKTKPGPAGDTGPSGISLQTWRRF
jgi:hypothetical protein